MATLAFLNHELQKRGVYDSFWSFMLSRETGVIGTAAGVTLGIVTAYLAYVLATGLLMPALAYGTTVPIGYVNKQLSRRLTDTLFGKSIGFQLSDVWHATLIWMLVIILVFVVLEGLRHIGAKLYQDPSQGFNNI